MKAIAKHTLIMANGKTLTTKDKEYEINRDDFLYCFVDDQNKNQYLIESLFRHFFSKVKEENLEEKKKDQRRNRYSKGTSSPS